MFAKLPLSWGRGASIHRDAESFSLGNYLTREGCSADSAPPVKSAKPSQTIAALNKMLVGNPTTSSEPNTGKPPLAVPAGASFAIPEPFGSADGGRRRKEGSCPEGTDHQRGTKEGRQEACNAQVSSGPRLSKMQS